MAVVDVRTGEIVPETTNPYSLLGVQPDDRVPMRIADNFPIEHKVTQQGQLLQVKIMRRGVQSEGFGTGGDRGNVTKFSRDSRKRMLDTVAKIDRKKIMWGKYKPKFITLTYEENMQDHKRARRDLKVFMERMQERFPKFACLWKKEIQQRGAIHFHLLIFGTPFILVNSDDPNVETLQRHWNQVNGENSKNSLDLKANLKSVNGVLFYVSKYMTKEEEYRFDGDFEACQKSKLTPYSMMCNHDRPKPASMGLSIPHIFSQLRLSTGRWWGVYGRKNMPYGERREVCGVASAKTMREFKTAIGGEYARVNASYTIYGGWVGGLFDKFLELWRADDDLNKAVWWEFRKKRFAALRLQRDLSGKETRRQLRWIYDDHFARKELERSRMPVVQPYEKPTRWDKTRRVEYKLMRWNLSSRQRV